MSLGALKYFINVLHFRACLARKQLIIGSPLGSSDYDYDYTNGITGVEEGKKRTASAADVIKSEYSKRAPEVKGDLYYSKRGADVKDDYDYDYNKRASTAESDYKRSV